MQWLSEQVRDKLWVYLYLDDAPEMESLVTAEALDIVNKLHGLGIESQYYTKEDAFSILKKKLPEVTADLEKYGISNPLPPTLYIVFDDENQRTQVKNIVVEYSDIIQNSQDIDESWFSFSEQERRVVDVLNVISIARVSMLFLLFVLGAIVVALILFLVESIYQRMYSDVEVKVLSGVSYGRISLPFLMVWVSVFFLWYLLQLGGLRTGYRYISQYLSRLFEVDAYELIFPVIVQDFEILLFFFGIVSCMIFWWILLRRRMKKMNG